MVPFICPKPRQNGSKFSRKTQSFGEIEKKKNFKQNSKFKLNIEKIVILGDVFKFHRKNPRNRGRKLLKTRTQGFGEVIRIKPFPENTSKKSLG